MRACAVAHATKSAVRTAVGHGTRAADASHTPGKAKAPAEAGALSAAGFANRKGIFHARFPALP